MSNLTSTIKSIQDIMRRDAGVDGDANEIRFEEKYLNALKGLEKQLYQTA